MIDILLAAYNGERYIEEQIDSLLKQSFKDWRLIVRDDCSNDNTPCILKAYADKYKDKIIFIEGDTPSGGAKQNFWKLLSFVESDYIMFCDQDDFWLENKVLNTFEAMKKAEARYGKNTPLLVHTDLAVVDEGLSLKASSMFSYQGLDKKAVTLNRLLCQNNITGCTVMINRSLLRLSKNFNTQKMLMHDWWLGLLAAAFGKVVFLDKAEILYRQHGKNQLGAVKKNSASRLSGAKKRLFDTYEQAEEFFLIYKNQLLPSELVCIKAYAEFKNINKLKRLYRIFKYDYKKQSLMLFLGQLFFC